jgi:hypothetical protein
VRIKPIEVDWLVRLYGRYLRDVLAHVLDKTSLFGTVLYLVIAGVVAAAAKLGSQIESSTVADATLKATLGWVALDVLVFAPARVAVGYLTSAEANRGGVTVNIAQVLNFGDPPSNPPMIPSPAQGVISPTAGDIDWSTVKTISQREVRLDAQHLPSPPRLHGVTFIDCEILGPVVIHAVNSEIAAKDQDIRRLLLEAPPGGADGYLYITDCTFRRCQFRQVSFVSPPDQTVTVS